jgi:type IV secretory pathway TrbD component
VLLGLDVAFRHVLVHKATRLFVAVSSLDRHRRGKMYNVHMDAPRTSISILVLLPLLVVALIIRLLAWYSTILGAVVIIFPFLRTRARDPLMSFNF